MQIRHYDIVRDSEELKTLLRSKLKQGSSIYALAKQTGLDRRNLSQFIRGTGNRAIKQWDAIVVAKQLGIEIELKLTVR
jgi:DNA-binding phage protein